MPSIEYLNEEFEKCRPQLRSYLLRMTASVEDTEDLVQETYLKAQEALMKLDMAREAGTKDKEQLFDLRMKIAQSIDPFTSDASELQLRHLQHNKQVMDEYLKEI